MKTLILLVISIMFSPFFALGQQEKPSFAIENGKVYFKSDAPLELIEANSDELRGLIDFSNGNFAFSIPASSFKGFNSSLQQEHFNENYLETDEFPRATFTGKIIENIDPSTNGEFSIRTKGILLIHGVEQERIIRATLKVSGGNIQINSNFSVLLRDHNITIPKVVYQKIAEEIYVEINAMAEKR